MAHILVQPEVPLASCANARSEGAGGKVPQGSYVEAVERFDVEGVAAKYPAAYGDSWRDQREAGCIRRFLSTLHAGCHVLDLPCGTGRLTPLLAERGLRIFGADSSPHMVTLAEAHWRDWQDRRPESDARATFEVREGANTGFADDEFDAIVCNRLFHHFRESRVRVAVLREFRRICHGRILLSFFNSFALDAIRFRLKHWLRGTTPTDRIPIPMDEIVRDAREAGLKVLGTSAVVWGISPLWYLELGPATMSSRAAA